MAIKRVLSRYWPKPRAQRDVLLGKAAEADLGDSPAARGEHNPTAPLGLDPLPEASSQTAALKDALGALTAPARAELNTLRPSARAT